MSFHAEAGDLIEIAATHLGESSRLGEVLEVLGTPGHEHYRVRWEDGHETLFYPSADAGVTRRVKTEEPVLVHEP